MSPLDRFSRFIGYVKQHDSAQGNAFWGLENQKAERTSKLLCQRTKEESNNFDSDISLTFDGVTR